MGFFERIKRFFGRRKEEKREKEEDQKERLKQYVINSNIPDSVKDDLIREIEDVPSIGKKKRYEEIEEKAKYEIGREIWKQRQEVEGKIGEIDRHLRKLGKLWFVKESRKEGDLFKSLFEREKEKLLDWTFREGGTEKAVKKLDDLIQKLKTNDFREMELFSKTLRMAYKSETYKLDVKQYWTLRNKIKKYDEAYADLMRNILKNTIITTPPPMTEEEQKYHDAFSFFIARTPFAEQAEPEPYIDEGEDDEGGKGEVSTP